MYKYICSFLFIFFNQQNRCLICEYGCGQKLTHLLHILFVFCCVHKFLLSVVEIKLAKYDKYFVMGIIGFFGVVVRYFFFFAMEISGGKTTEENELDSIATCVLRMLCPLYVYCLFTLFLIWLDFLVLGRGLGASCPSFK